jgi:hypothetical protein
MSIKVFCNPAYIDGYQNNPADGFKITVPFRVFCSDGGDSNGPRNFDSEAIVVVDIGATAIDAYSAVYADILTQCANAGWPTPAKTDIYGYAPVGMGAILPTLPEIA